MPTSSKKEISFFSGHLAELQVDMLAWVVSAPSWQNDAWWKSLGKPLQTLIKEKMAAAHFTGAPRQEVVVATQKHLPASYLVLIGTLPPADETLVSHAVLAAVGQAIRWSQKLHCQRLAVLLDQQLQHLPQIPALLTRAVHLSQYQFTHCLGSAPKPHKTAIQVCFPSKAGKETRGWQAGAAIAAATAQARHWGNLPSNQKYPEHIAEMCGQWLRNKPHVQVILKKKRELTTMGMRLMLAVGQGSEAPPCLLHARYTPPKSKNLPPIVLIGKGITFDSGGLSLKPPDAMYGMKADMSGAAAVMAALGAIAQLRLPYPVHAFAAFAENMPSGSAIRPGDIVKSHLGKTVEINNTDAEGRLVLADVLSYAQSLKPRCMIDVATLTGACMVALGPDHIGLFANQDRLANQLLKAAHQAGELIWHMPLAKNLTSQLKSECADMRNTGERYGGAITAALFLNDFVGQVPWAHLDIAGPATSSSEYGIFSKGATGIAVATLVQFVHHQAERNA